MKDFLEGKDQKIFMSQKNQGKLMQNNKKPGILENFWLHVWNITFSKMGPGIRRQRCCWGVNLSGGHLKQKLVQVFWEESLTWLQLLVRNLPFSFTWFYTCCVLFYIFLNWYRRIMIPAAFGYKATPLWVMYINILQRNLD